MVSLRCACFLAGVILASLQVSGSKHPRTSGSEYDGHKSEYRRNHGDEERRQRSTMKAFQIENGGDSVRWTDWGEWSSCTKTCGFGISIRTRECVNKGSINSSDKSVKSEAGQGCVGVYKEIQTCNTQLCPTGIPTSRESQCSEFNNKAFMGRQYQWEPFINPKGHCELTCRAKGFRFYARLAATVADGTPCVPGDDDVCIAGSCKKVGCDGMVGSDAVVDMCGECKGDNSTCNVMTGTIRSDQLVQGYNTVVHIPKGATNINVTELRSSSNFLAVRTSGDTYILNGPRELSSVGEYFSAGTKFTYHKNQEGWCPGQCFNAIGPISEAIEVQILYYHHNPGIRYQYSIPKATGESIVLSKQSIPTPTQNKPKSPSDEDRELEGYLSDSREVQNDERSEELAASRLHQHRGRTRDAPHGRTRHKHDQSSSSSRSKHALRFPKYTQSFTFGRTRVVKEKYRHQKADVPRTDHRIHGSSVGEARSNSRETTNRAASSETQRSPYRQSSHSRYTDQSLRQSHTYARHLNNSRRRDHHRSQQSNHNPQRHHSTSRRLPPTDPRRRTDPRYRHTDSLNRQTDLRHQGDHLRRQQTDARRHGETDLRQRQTDLRQRQTDLRQRQADLRRSQTDLQRRQTELRNRQTDLRHQSNVHHRQHHARPRPVDRRTNTRTDARTHTRQRPIGNDPRRDSSNGYGSLTDRNYRPTYNVDRARTRSISQDINIRRQPVYLGRTESSNQALAFTTRPTDRPHLPNRLPSISQSVENRVGRNNTWSERDISEYNRILWRQNQVGDQEYSWKISGLTDCTATCGGGYQETIIVCVKRSSQVVVTDENCEHGPKPEVHTVICNQIPCPAEWHTTEWGRCSVTCDTGVQTREVLCKRKISISVNLTVPAEDCAELTRPTTSQRCATEKCFRWVSGNWTKCSAPCGKGERTRDVMCRTVDGEQADEAECTRRDHKPRQTEVCDLGSCGIGWFYTQWPSQCPAHCGEGLQKRKLHCAGPRGNPLAENKCEKFHKPETTRSCKTSIPCGGKWFTGVWSKCNSTCGYGVQKRDVVCMKKLGSSFVTVVEEENCILEERPATEGPCENLPRCRPEWYMKDWGECSASCGTGYRVREVKCLDERQIPSPDCLQEDKPITRESCNVHSCKRAKLPTDKSCQDTFNSCNLVVQARLCRFKYYKKVCCDSCVQSGQISVE